VADGPVVVGVDVGATKTHVRCCRVDGGLVSDQVLTTQEWRGTSAVVKARRLAALATAAAGGAALAGLGVGAHGCDSGAQCRELADALRPLVATPCVVVNDARLVGPAAGRENAVGVVAGTGSIAVGVLPDGDSVYAGGWGWLLGDEGGATGLVREAARAALRADEDDRPDEVLAGLLASAAGVASIRRLPLHMMTTRAEVWADYAPVVFRAADEGSPLAEHVIERAGQELARLVGTVIRKGALAGAVVAAGGMISHQTRLADAFAAAVRRCHDVEVLTLTEPPVVGAVELAQAVADSPGRPAKP
jgi:N-acetylglucosamine kinase-like BadF-type ATPase